MGQNCFRWAALSLLAAAVAFPLLAGGDTTPKLDRSWKHYHNPAWAYCVSYPSRWMKGDAFEGAGLFVEAGADRHSRPTGEIDVAALPIATAAAKLTLVDSLQVHLEGLKRFERAEKLEVLDKREKELQGSSALFSKARYFDPQDGHTWMEEIVLAEHSGTLFRIELECRADQAERFEAVFARLTDSFQFNCSN